MRAINVDLPTVPYKSWGEKPSSGKLDYCFQVVTGQMRNDLVWSYMCEHGKIEWKLRVGERGKERNAAGLAMEV